MGIEKAHRQFALMTRGQVNDALHRAVVAHCKAWALDPDDPRQYVAALRAVQMNDPELARAYAGAARVDPGGSRGERADVEVDRRARQRTRERREDYQVALHHVLDEDPALRDRYLRGG